MNVFEIQELTVSDCRVQFTIVVNSEKPNKVCEFGPSSWPTIARDALHKALAKTWPGLRKEKIPGGDDVTPISAWHTVVQGYKLQISVIPDRQKEKSAKDKAQQTEGSVQG